MVSTKLCGGVGNQLFQIATTIAFAKDNGFEYGFDLSETNLPLQGNPAKEYERTLYYYLPKIKHSDYNFEVYKEPRWEYTPIPPKDNIILDGYFQSWRYFDHRKEELLELFLSDDVKYGSLNRVEDQYCVELYNSVSIHLRVGDYRRFPNIHPIPDSSYYMNAIEQISRKFKVNCLLIFSDDINYAKEEIRSPNARFVENLNDLDSMLLMSLCNHNVIANSSFSWWASYFNIQPYHTVYAPKQWFGQLVKHGWDDIYRKEFIIL